jgi:hypothetical protein
MRCIIFKTKSEFNDLSKRINEHRKSTIEGYNFETWAIADDFKNKKKNEYVLLIPEEQECILTEREVFLLTDVPNDDEDYFPKSK